MTREDVQWTLKEIIARVAGIPLHELEDEHQLRSELMLDSLKEMEIVARTEMLFGIDLDESALLRLKTLGEYCDLVADALSLSTDR